MSTAKAAFVLVHGAWHNHSSWSRIKPLLEAKGHAVVALDLPGAGANAIAPRSLDVRPFDLAEFAAEPSPNANVTQKERTQAVILAVREAAALSEKIVLVGHSAGGVTISAVAEQIPELLSAVVYLAGYMVPPGLSLLAMFQHDSMSAALSTGLFVGDPIATGVIRINPGSADDAYRSLLKASFYADVTDADFAEAASKLHCDEPNGTALAPSEITPTRFGAVPRHYIRTTQDRAVPLFGQDNMISAVDEAIGGKTITHTMESSHSPFLSQPANLSEILIEIAAHPTFQREHDAGLDT